MNEGKTGGGVLGKLGVKARGNLAFRQASVRVDVIRQLHACMREQRMGRNELADKSGKNRDEVTRMFSGVLPFTLDDLVSLAHALGARVEVRLVSDQASMPEEGLETVAAVKPTAAATVVEAIPEAVPMPEEERPESVSAAVADRAPAKTAVEAIEAIEAVDMMHGMKDSATQFLAEMQSAYQKERRERERRPTAAGPQKTRSFPGAFPPATPAMSSPFHGVDVLNSMAGMEDMKDHDRQFLEDMQRAYHRESRNRLSGGGVKQPSLRPAMGFRSQGATGFPETSAGMEDRRDQDQDQQFLDDMRMALEAGGDAVSESVVIPEAPAHEEAPQDEEDASVVMDALAEMSGEEKHLFEEMWAAVQHDGGKRAPKDLGTETAAPAPKKAL